MKESGDLRGEMIVERERRMQREERWEKRGSKYNRWYREWMDMGG